MAKVFKHSSQGKEPLLLIHGFLGSHEDWELMLEGLSNRFAVSSIDLPSHGISSPISPKINSFDDLIEEVYLNIRQEFTGGIGVGYSLGGRILLGLQHKAPELFSELVLISSSPGIKSEEDRIARKQSDLCWIEKILNLPPEDFFTEWYRQPIFSSEHWSEDLRSLIFNRRKISNRESLSKMLEICSPSSMPNYWSEIQKLGSKLTYICGQRDQKYLKLSEEISLTNSEAHCHVVEKSGHLLPLEAPQQLAAILETIGKYR